MANDHPTLGNGKICYIQIPSLDIHRSAAFFRDVFGWNIRERSDGHLPFDDGVNEVSGEFVAGREPGANTGLLVYIMVDDIEAAITAILAHGGRVVQPVGGDAPEITARFSDPAGNVWGLGQQ